MKKDIRTLENMASLYHQLEQHGWGIAERILEKTHTVSAIQFEQLEWEFLYGDLYFRFQSKDSRCPCGGCGEYEYTTIDFPAKLIMENEDGVQMYLEALEEKGQTND